MNAVVSAIRAWGIISSSTTSSPAVRGTAPATIMLNTNGGICTGGCLAATLTGYYVTQTGDDRIYDADIYTNTAFQYFSSGEPACSGEYDIDGIMTHEVGHVIGLGHSSVSGATMFPRSARATRPIGRSKPTTERDATTCIDSWHYLHWRVARATRQCPHHPRHEHRHPRRPERRSTT